jgi:hypothetical protein
MRSRGRRPCRALEPLRIVQLPVERLAVLEDALRLRMTAERPASLVAESRPTAPKRAA